MLTSTPSPEARAVFEAIARKIDTSKNHGFEPRCIILGQNPSRELSEHFLNNWRPLPPDTELFGLPVVTVFHDVEAIQVGI